MIGITIDRNVTSRRMNARPRTNANTIGRCDLIVSLKSFEPAVMPVTSVRTPRTRPSVCGITVVAEVGERRLRARVGAVAGHRQADDREVVARVDLRPSPGWPKSSDFAATSRSFAIPACTSGARTSSARTTITAGSGPPGNAAWMRS